VRELHEASSARTFRTVHSGRADAVVLKPIVLSSAPDMLTAVAQSGR
jgi:hypothetical protein